MYFTEVLMGNIWSILFGNTDVKTTNAELSDINRLTIGIGMTKN